MKKFPFPSFIIPILGFLLFLPVQRPCAQEKPSIYLNVLNAETDMPIPSLMNIRDSFTINLAEMPTRNLNLEAKIRGLKSIPKSVHFKMDRDSVTQIEYEPPYALGMDTVGDFFNYHFLPGKHTLEIIAYNDSQGFGKILAKEKYFFEVVDQHTPKLERIFPSIKDGITLNGHLNDWEKLDENPHFFFQDRELSRAQGDRNQIWGQGTWNATYFYLGFKIRDTRIMGFSYKHFEDLSSDDGLDIFIYPQGTEQGQPGSGIFKISFGIHNNLNVQKGKIEKGEISWAPVHKNIEDLGIFLFVRLLGTANKNTDLDSGYQVELAIPFKFLGTNPKPGQWLGIEVINRDNDYEKGNQTALSGNLLNKDNPNKWIRFGLGEPGAWFPAPGIKPNLGTSAFFFEKVKWFFAFLVVLGIVYFGILFKKTVNFRKKLKSELEIRVKEFIEQNYMKNVVLEDFCKKYGLSLRVTQKWLKDKLKVNFNELLTRKKMEEAKKLLESSEKTVSEIAYSLGFNSSSYFGSLFKRAYGVSPQEIKKTRDFS